MGRGDELGMRCSTEIPLRQVKPSFCKHKRTNKMDPKARAYVYLDPAMNNPTESKRILVDSGNVIVTRNITRSHLPCACPMTTQSKPSEEGEVDVGTEDREASSVEGPASGHIGDCSPEHRGYAYHGEGFLRHGRL